MYFPSYAQNPYDYTLSHYSDINGLPQNSVKTIAKDDGDFLWLATEGGLTRFDGNSFMLFDKEATHTLSSRIFTLRKNLKSEHLYAQTEYHELIPISKGQTLNAVSFNQAFPDFNPEIQVQESPVTFPDKPKLAFLISKARS